jgi:hypothetical protein
VRIKRWAPLDWKAKYVRVRMRAVRALTCAQHGTKAFIKIPNKVTCWIQAGTQTGFHRLTKMCH